MPFSIPSSMHQDQTIGSRKIKKEKLVLKDYNYKLTKQA
jgi:hypothetical protein